MGWKMATVNPPERKFNKKEDKMHFPSPSAWWAVLGTLKLHLKGLERKFYEFVASPGTSYFAYSRVF